MIHPFYVRDVIKMKYFPLNEEVFELFISKKIQSWSVVAIDIISESKYLEFFLIQDIFS